MRPAIINFCPTGMVPMKEHNASVPIAVEEIVSQVHEAFEVGITLAHLHARHADGTAAWEPEIYQRIMEGVRKHCPGLVICLSTSGRLFPEFEKRSAVIELRPDMCSLTLGSLNFMDQASINSPEMIKALAMKMVDHGVRPEFECFDTGMITYGLYLRRKLALEGPTYWNLLFGNIAGMQADLTSMAAATTMIPGEDGHHVVLAGLGTFQLTVTTTAIAHGHGVRVGLEDNLWYDRQRHRPATNIDLLRRVHALMEVHERPLLTTREFGRSGFYNAYHATGVKQ
ncbi:MAG: 3-keto-5-aminohexanoate cleavage protein [Flavobacteriales bacterium]